MAWTVSGGFNYRGRLYRRTEDLVDPESSVNQIQHDKSFCFIVRSQAGDGG